MARDQSWYCMRAQRSTVRQPNWTLYAEYVEEDRRDCEKGKTPRNEEARTQKPFVKGAPKGKVSVYVRRELGGIRGIK